MIQSQNKKIDLTIKATSYLGLNSYGTMMIGDSSIEFYNDRNVADYIQIPWDEIDYVAASIMFKGRIIPRFAIMTKNNGNYSFSTRNNKLTLKTMKSYLKDEQLVRSLTFLDVIKKGLKKIFKIKK